jgi:hypothetical protein
MTAREAVVAIIARFSSARTPKPEPAAHQLSHAVYGGRSGLRIRPLITKG